MQFSWQALIVARFSRVAMLLRKPGKRNAASFSRIPESEVPRETSDSARKKETADVKLSRQALIVARFSRVAMLFGTGEAERRELLSYPRIGSPPRDF